MYNGILLLTDGYGNSIGKPKDTFKKLAYPIELNSGARGTRVWFTDGECVDCVEHPNVIAKTLNT